MGIEENIVVFSSVIVLALGLFLFARGPRPRLLVTGIETSLPKNTPLRDLDSWLNLNEKKHKVIDGTEAKIEWAGNLKQKRDLSVLYIHGFSASRQEISPTVSVIAEKLGANAVYARLAGHGLKENVMEAAAEEWLKSALDSWEIAAQIGQNVVIIATSTGAPISVWLASELNRAKKTKGLIFVSPNFKIRLPVGFLLTLPYAYHWIKWLLGSQRTWTPENSKVAKYWTSSYSTRALIEMQKVVDWAREFVPTFDLPLLTFYVKNDPTINHQSAISYHNSWPSSHKKLVSVTSSGGAPKHIFVGDISGPEKNDWFVNMCFEFLGKVPDQQNGQENKSFSSNGQ